MFGPLVLEAVSVRTLAVISEAMLVLEAVVHMHASAARAILVMEAVRDTLLVMHLVMILETVCGIVQSIVKLSNTRNILPPDIIIIITC